MATNESLTEDQATIIEHPDSDSKEGSAENAKQTPRSAPEDELKIGDRVWFNVPEIGTVSGRIQYYGQVGVTPSSLRVGLVLDPEFKAPPPAFHSTGTTPKGGANDGAYKGKRYFACEPGRGYFRKITECFRKLPNDALLRDPSEERSEFDDDTVSICSSFATPSNAGDLDLCIGDRVLIKPSRAGSLRFLGETKFAPGIWAGIELDMSLGKNDGLVAGVRYFKCKPNHGLFTKAKNVIKISTNPGAARRKNSLTAGGQSWPTEVPRSFNLNTEAVLGPRKYSTYSLSRAGSQESLRSEASFVSLRSSASQRRLPARTLPKPGTLLPTLGTLADCEREELKDTKNREIERWLVENRTQKDEIERITRKFQEKCAEFHSVSSEHDSYKRKMDSDISDLRTQVEEFEKQNEELEARLKEEKLKSEEFQFQLEEVTINKDLLLESDMEKLALHDDGRDEVDARSLAKDKGEEIARLEVEKDSLQARLENLEMEWISLNRDKEALSEVNKELEQRLTTLEAEGDKVNVEVSLLQSSSRRDVSEREHLAEKLALAERRAQEMGEQLAGWEGKYATLEGALACESRKVEDGLEAEARCAKDAAELKAQVERCQAVVVEKLDRIDYLERALKAQSESGSVQLEFAEQLERAHEESLDKLTRLKDQSARWERVAKDKTEALENLERQVLAKADQMVQLQSRMEKMTGSHLRESQDLRDRVQDLERSCLELQELMIREKEQERKEREQEKRALLEEGSHKVERLKDELLLEMEKKLVEESHKLSDALNYEKKIYTEKIQGLEDRLGKSLDQVEALEMEKREAELRCNTVMEKLSEAHAQLDEVAQRTEERENIIHILREENVSLQQTVSTTGERCNKAFGELNSLRAQLTHAEAELGNTKEERRTSLEEGERLRESKMALEKELQMALVRAQFDFGLKLTGGDLLTPDSINNDTNGRAPDFMADVNHYEGATTMHQDCIQTQQFLNSVIVDMNKQLEVLQQRVKQLREVPDQLSPSESMCFTPSDDEGGLLQTPQQFSAWALTKAPSKPPQTLDHRIKKKAFAKERDYCDNCQEFDLHDTSKCHHGALEGSDDAETKGAGEVFFNPSFGQEDRVDLPFQAHLYCENCLRIGHDTYECRFMRPKETRLDSVQKSS